MIAATNVDLGANVEEGTFRRDLYYRLNVLPITLPSLRVCAADTPALADCFLKLHRGRKAVASSPKPAGVRVSQLMSRGRAPGAGQPPREGASVGYPLSTASRSKAAAMSARV